MKAREQSYYAKGVAVAEWSKALLLREKMNEKHKEPGFASLSEQPF